MFIVSNRISLAATQISPFGSYFEYSLHPCRAQPLCAVFSERNPAPARGGLPGVDGNIHTTTANWLCVPGQHPRWATLDTACCRVRASILIPRPIHAHVGCSQLLVGIGCHVPGRHGLSAERRLCSRASRQLAIEPARLRARKHTEPRVERRAGRGHMRSIRCTLQVVAAAARCAARSAPRPARRHRVCRRRRASQRRLAGLNEVRDVCAAVAGLEEVRGLRAARARLGCLEPTAVHQARQRGVEAQLGLPKVAHRARGQREQLRLQCVAVSSKLLGTAAPLLPATRLVAQLDRLVRVRARVRVRVRVLAPPVPWPRTGGGCLRRHACAARRWATASCAAALGAGSAAAARAAARRA